jgi:small subunit ribosomal protein S8e
MARSQARPRLSVTGSRYKAYRKKKQHELGGVPVFTKIGKKNVHTVRTMGSNQKLKLIQEEFVNVYNKSTKKHAKVKIKTVVENKANPHYVRRNIITKGTVVDTELGRVRITSRPGQIGLCDGILVEAAKAK